MTGKSFCVSAKHAFELVVEKAGTFLALGSAGTIFNLLGRLLISCASTYIGYMIITYVEYYSDRINSPIPGVVAFAIVSYLIASLFMSVFEMASDAIL